MEGSVAAAEGAVPGIVLDGEDVIVETGLGVVVVVVAAAEIFVAHKEEKWVPNIRSVRWPWRLQSK